MLMCVEGVYANGKIELLETPDCAGASRVLVTFLETAATLAGNQCLVYGKYPGPQMSTEEDFKIAEWHGEDIDNDGD